MVDGLARRCECKLNAPWQAAGLPPRYWKKKFADYDPTVHPSAEQALIICKRFVEDWPTLQTDGQGLTLTGPVGLGKTHLVCCVLKACSVKWGAKIAFIDLPALFAKIKTTFDPESPLTEGDVLHPVLTADLLAIDELAAARQSDWNFQMTEYVLNERYNRNLSTLITTNFLNRQAGWSAPSSGLNNPLLLQGGKSGAGQEAASAMRRDTLGDRIGARMFSRVQEMTRVIEMDGEDQRLRVGARR